MLILTFSNTHFSENLQQNHTEIFCDGLSICCGFAVEFSLFYANEGIF